MTVSSATNSSLVSALTGTTSTDDGSTDGLSTTNSSATAISGLGSGIDTTSIINALMEVNAQTENQLKAQQTTISTKIADYQDLNTKMLALQTAAETLGNPNDWNQLVASSSNSTAATASVSGGGGQSGSVTFSVQQLATANVMASAMAVSSTSSTIASGNIFVSASGYALGITSVAGDSSLALGSHTIAVTQASQAASVTGGAPAGSTTISQGVNDTFTATVNGQSKTYTLAAGTYTSSQLATALGTASGGALNATVDPASGGITVATANEGSQATLQLTGGTALSALGLEVGGQVSGGDGIVTVDGTSSTLTDVPANGQLTLSSGTGGNVTLTTSGHLAAGSMTGAQVSTGDGSLSAVVSAINGANMGVSASAIRTGDNAYRLQLSSQSTGANSQIEVSGSAFSAAGGLTTVVAGQDALLHVGGSTGYDVTSSSNTINGLMPGVNVTLTGTTTADNPVTISAAADSSGIADEVNTFVTAANTLLTQLNTYGGYNATTQTAGDLMGDGAVMDLRNQVLNLVSSVRTGPGGTGVDSAGINLTSSGALTFDRNAFLTAFNTDPTGVAARFSAGGTLTPSSPAYAGSVSYVYSPGTVPAGSYDVQLTQSATQASVTGAPVTGALTAAETLSVQQNGTTANFAATAGQTLADVAAGLNASMSQAGLGVTASVVTDASGTHLALSGSDYGSSDSFDVSSTGTGTGLTSSANTWTSYTGLNVAGTINGIAATGSGQVLSVPTGSGSLSGLALMVTAPGISSGTPVDLGGFSYAPGLGSQMQGLSVQFSDPVNGDFAFSLTQLNAQYTGLSTQISDQDTLLTQQRTLLQQQFDTMETAIATLKSTGDMLTSALAGTSSS
jgi:flagellar hook-associated protein 2